MRTFTNTLVKLSELSMAENVRLPENLDLEALCEDIAEVGLKTPPQVWKPDAKKAKVEILQGHRRLMALQMLQSSNKERFNELFPEGVPVVMVTGIDVDEAATLKVDHGNVKPLTDPYELLASARMLFNAGHTETTVVRELRGIMEAMAPMKGKKATTRNTLSEALTELRKQGDKADPEKLVMLENELTNLEFEYRRGMVQNLHNAARCPILVDAALYQQSTGETKPEYVDDPIIKGVRLPKKLTTAMVTKLWQAHSKDLDMSAAKYNQRVTGPHFKAEWDAILASEDEADKKSKDGEKRAKSMSAKDMQTEIKEGKFHSDFGRQLTEHHLGNKVDLRELDLTAYYAELVKEHDDKLWGTVVARARAIESEIIKAAEAEVQSAPTEDKAPKAKAKKGSKASK